MNKKLSFLISTLLFLSLTLGWTIKSCSSEEKERDPWLQPFSHLSIWNMPIGDRAIYVHAHIEPATKAGMTLDEDYIVFTPNEPLQPVYMNYAGWNKEKDRCIREGKEIFSAPIPTNFIVSKETWDGATPNAGLAVLMPDGRTIRQTQPFAQCTAGKATSEYDFGETDLYGDGMYGAHGGSGLSAIGGTLRLHELTPESGPIKHALKINLFGRKNLYYDEKTKGFRWPALNADSYAEREYYKDRTNQVVEACRMGALLAIPPFITIESLKLETEPAKILAQALQDYGAYVVDDTAWDVYAFCVEWSPCKRFSEEFEKNWGFPFSQSDLNTPWTRDMKRIFTILHVVDNNSPTSVGGGGKPRVPLAIPLKEPVY